MIQSHTFRALLLSVALSGCAPAFAQDLPLVASYSLETQGETSPDNGPLKLDLKVQNATVVPGKVGNALRFDGAQSFAQSSAEILHKLRADFSVTFWAKIERFPQSGGAYLVQKGGNAGWQVGVSERRAGFIHGYSGGLWYNTNFDGDIKADTWTHVAMTMKKGDKMRLYFDGVEVASAEAPFAFTRENDAFKIGGGFFTGTLDEVKIFAAPLSPAQIQADMRGKTLPTRAATDADFPIPGYGVRMALARFDQPIGFQSYDGRQRQTAQRVSGPDAVDWPVLHTEDGAKLFDKGGQTNLEVNLVSGGQAMPPIRQKWDHEIQPVNHWFRANEWLWGRSFVYTTDRTARTSAGDYEIWAFPIQIGDPKADPSARPIQTVALKLGGETIYEKTESLRSLTLLLSANLNGTPYELSVNGGEAARFDVGLLPLVAGHPREEAMPVDVAIPGTTLRARLALSTQNANGNDWKNDLKAMATWKAPADEAAPASGMARFMGAGVARAPLSIFTASMRAGMSGGHRFSGEHTVPYAGTPTEYADHLASLGFDFVYETAQPKDLDSNRDLQAWARGLQARGVGFDLNPAIPGNLDILANPNLAFLSTYLPEWGAPAFRDAQLLAGRFGRYPNFGGLMIGADNAGYVSYWDWAPTIPDRPWARALEAHLKAQNLANVPVGPAISPSKVFEKRGTEREFLDYIASYDKTFRRYGYFARALREVKPNLSLTTGSFGSSPGVGARGGWPWATIPARPMHDEIPLLTAYDWNEQPSTKSMHLPALIDRLQSEYPNRPLQALVDDFNLHLTREARQQAYALALTRGVQSIGTTFLVHPKQRADKLSIQDDQRELSSWIHRFSGAYSQMKLQPTVGVLYVHDQAISRPIVPGGENASEADLLRGSHEGKTTEALFFANAAGFPAKIVTPSELKRGLPSSMKSLLLVGLNRFDETWLWSDGMESELKKFVAAGGKLVRDDETALPEGLTASAPGMQVRAYVVQSAQDQTKLLLDRNADNITKLRGALMGVEVPLARSTEAETWAIPTRAGDVDYLTLVNQGMKPAGKGAISRAENSYVAGNLITEQFDPEKYLIPAPRTTSIEWKAKTGVIYDLRSQKKITPAQAEKVDFTRDAFQLLAVSPRAVSAPKVTFEAGKSGFWSARVSVAAPALRGVPVQLDITQDGETVSVYGASETPVALPLPLSQAANAQIVAMENFSGLKTSVNLARPAQKIAATLDTSISAFWARKNVPLVIALTPAQMQTNLGEKLLAYAKKSGREAQVQPIESVVQSLQPLRAIQRFPQWQTTDADLILLGSPTENLLVFDQARGGLIDETKAQQVTFSPFVGEKWALNLRDETALEVAQ